MPVGDTAPQMGTGSRWGGHGAMLGDTRGHAGQAKDCSPLLLAGMGGIVPQPPGARQRGNSPQPRDAPGFAGRAVSPARREATRPVPALGTSSHTSLDEDPRGPGLVLAGVPQVPLRFLRGPGAERGERRPAAPPRPWLTRLVTPRPPHHSRQKILHFLHGDFAGGVQRVLHAAVGRVDGAGREGGRVLLGGPWGATGMGGRAGRQPQHRAGHGASPGAGPTRTWWGQWGHSRSLSLGEHRLSGLRGTWVPLACGSFGVAIKLLLQENVGRSYSWSQCHGVAVQGGCHPKPPTSPGHVPPEAGGVLEPGDLQPAQRLRHVPGAQREALELRRRNQVETWRWGDKEEPQGPAMGLQQEPMSLL